MDWSQYIRPGEFSYCGCGILLVPVRGQVCGSCQASGLNANKTERSSQESLDYGRGLRADALLVNDCLEQARQALAHSRYTVGYKPLFWLNEKEQMLAVGKFVTERIEQANSGTDSHNEQ